MKTILLAAVAVFSLNANTMSSGNVGGVNYTLQPADVGQGYVDYTWYFDEPVSSYSADLVWYGYPANYRVTASYGGISQASINQYGILLLTVSGSRDVSQAGMQYDPGALNILTIDFENEDRTQFVYPSLTFTSLVDPPLHAFAEGPATPDAPEPGTIALTALGLFGLSLGRRWLTPRNRLA